MITYQQDECVLFELEGLLDGKKGSFLQQGIATIESSHHTIWIVDLAQVTLIDSAGLVSLVSSLSFANRHECRFVLHNPPQAVNLVLEIARLDRVFETVHSAAENSKEIVDLFSRAKSEILLAA